MSEHTSPGVGRSWVVPMVARRSDEEHRAATPLELFFDLCFVAAVSQAATTLHHDLSERHFSQGLVGYSMMFFAIWWAWMNFTWFASAYDTDDVPYRLFTFVQISGVLVLAAGVPRAMDEREFGYVVLGYVIMRFAMVGQWLRAAFADPPRRTVALRYAGGIAACQVFWLSLLFLAEAPATAAFLIGVVAELAVPVWAERAERTTWHPHHIAERYGLFTLIVLGESIISATVAFQAALDSDADAVNDLVLAALGGLLIVFSMWWLYFAQPANAATSRARRASDETMRWSFIWGYSHVFVFASAAAVGAGIAVVVDDVTGHSELTRRGALLSVAVPAAIYVVSVWLTHRRGSTVSTMDIAAPVTAVLMVGAALVGLPLVVIGLILAALVAVKVVAPPAEGEVSEDPVLA